tara:strand:- start:1272 stop:1535 length:264 start_codon:yes stop_codon:yes gene_type:complete
MPKQFKDLKFENHPLQPSFNKRVKYTLDNGYGVSIINGSSAYCNDETYEVAILKDEEISYDTEFTDNVLEYQTPEDIDKLLINLAKL